MRDMSNNTIRHLDLSSTSDYDKALVPLDKLVKKHGTANSVFARLGRLPIREIFKSGAPEAFTQIISLRENLDSEGVAVLHETQVERVDDELAQMISIAIASTFGEPTKTDQLDDRIAWPIKYDSTITVTPTFSQALGEAAYHTDTQYFENPEKYFGLFCITSDNEGKGTNLLVNGVEAVEAFTERYGEEAAAVLNTKYPFRVPSAFTKGGRDTDVEVVWAPIFSKETQSIRYRKDTILRALGAAAGVAITDQQYEVLTQFDDFLKDTKAVGYHLEPSDGILVNNHRMLHARTFFDNPDRFLYRVRMADETEL